MSFRQNTTHFEREMDAFYATCPADVGEIIAEMERLDAENPHWGPCRRKAMIYETAARMCDVHVFRHYPFFYEIVSGRPRHDWGIRGLGGWLRTRPAQRELERRSIERQAPAREAGLLRGPSVLDHDHHCVGYDNVLAVGLNGLITRAEARLRRGVSDEQRDFLDAAVIGCRSLIALAGRFADTARLLAAEECDPGVRVRLERTARTGDRVPAEPPRTFHEALNTILFLREACGSLEGIGESILGHLDRMLAPYLRADLDAGRITLADARDGIDAFLAMTDVKFGIRREPRETSTTVVIGGCDRRGRPVFNDVTRLIVDAYRELGLVNPKLNARISREHPAEYFDLLADLAGRGRNVVAVFNDDVLIEANARMGKAVEDCRLYVGGGCQENVLQNTEINSRASIYLNLAQVFLMGFFPEAWRHYAEHAGITLQTYHGSESFADFRGRFLANLRAVTNDQIDARNATEAHGRWYSPCPLHSATLDDCLERAKDMNDGGTRYATRRGRRC